MFFFLPFSLNPNNDLKTFFSSHRLKKEMKAFMESPPPFIPEIFVDDNDITSELVVVLFFEERKRI